MDDKSLNSSSKKTKASVNKEIFQKIKKLEEFAALINNYRNNFESDINKAQHDKRGKNYSASEASSSNADSQKKVSALIKDRLQKCSNALQLIEEVRNLQTQKSRQLSGASGENAARWQRRRSVLINRLNEDANTMTLWMGGTVSEPIPALCGCVQLSISAPLQIGARVAASMVAGFDEFDSCENDKTLSENNSGGVAGGGGCDATKPIPKHIRASCVASQFPPPPLSHSPSPSSSLITTTISASKRSFSVGKRAKTAIATTAKSSNQIEAEGEGGEAPHQSASSRPEIEPGKEVDCENGTWILADLIAFDASSGLYTVEDVDAEEGQKAKKYQLTRSQIIQLPRWKCDPVCFPAGIFPVGTLVLALYPQTTCFYRGYIKERPKNVHDKYSVLFEDPTYPDGFAPPLEIPQKYVTRGNAAPLATKSNRASNNNAIATKNGEGCITNQKREIPPPPQPVDQRVVTSQLAAAPPSNKRSRKSAAKHTPCSASSS